jgi:hypothetical protein
MLARSAACPRVGLSESEPSGSEQTPYENDTAENRRQNAAEPKPSRSIEAKCCTHYPADEEDRRHEAEEQREDRLYRLRCSTVIEVIGIHGRESDGDART